MYQCINEVDGQLFYGLDGYHVKVEAPQAGNNQVKPKWTSPSKISIAQGQTLRMKCIFEGNLYLLCHSNYVCIFIQLHGKGL